MNNNTIFRILVLMLCMGVTSLIAQKKTALVEHFTNTKCPICKSNNPGFYARYNKYKEDAIHIAYHPSVPYNTCIFYMANKEGNGARQSHYDIIGTPVAFINGKAGSSTLPSDADYQNALNEIATYDITIISATPGSIEVRITTLNALPGGDNLRLFTALTENYISYNAPNGETEHYDVFRKFIGDQNEGIAVDFEAGSAAGSSKTLSLGAIDYSQAVGWNNYSLIAFISKNGARDILQAARSAISPVAGTGDFEKSRVYLTAYPNPARDHLRISWNDPSFIPHEADIFNSEGHFMRKIKITTSGPAAGLDLRGLSTGVYLYQLKDRTNRYNAQGKFIVQ